MPLVAKNLKKLWVFVVAALILIVVSPAATWANAPSPTPANINNAISGAIGWIKAEPIEHPWEWNALGIARAGQVVPDDYYANLEQYLTEKNGNFRKVTDYERMALAVTALGKDPKNVAGYNLLENIYNNEHMTNQGTNGPVFALIALDSANYAMPENAKWNRTQLVDWILQQQEPDGGFPLTKGETNSDIDITAMTLQALSNYQNRADVKEATQKAINFLSTNQEPHGGYYSWGTDNSESVAQTIIALTALGINPATDPRFVKANGNLVSRLLYFVEVDGGFAHEKESGQGSNNMATEQGLMGLVAYDRFLKGQNKLYDMRDVTGNQSPAPVKETPTTPKAPSLDNKTSEAKEIILTINQPLAVIGGAKQQLDAPPTVDAKTNRVLVPIRFVSEALGAAVDWDGSKGQVTVKNSERVINLTLNSTSAIVNGQTVALDSAPTILPPNRIFVPLRFVSENLGAGVNYDAANQQIVITTK